MKVEPECAACILSRGAAEVKEATTNPALRYRAMCDLLRLLMKEFRPTAVAAELGVSYRSVIAKAKQLGVEYIPKPAPAKVAKGPTKLELVAEIAEASGMAESKLVGLEKAPKAVLEALVARFGE